MAAGGPATPEQAAAGFRAAGLPAVAVDDLLVLFAALAEGRQSLPTSELHEVLGRAPRGVEDFVAGYLPVWAGAAPA